MDRDSALAGMCVVRVWRNGEGLLIRVVSLVDVAPGGFAPGLATVRPEEAVEFLREFLSRCVETL